MLLSQDRVAEMSGLSLRTVQRLEAGHRVSYASLRAIAAAVNTDADLLEREFYAAKQPADEFIETPRWVRFLTDRLWFGGPRLSRRDVLLIEASCALIAVITFAASWLVPLSARASVVRMSAVVPLLCGYLIATSIRLADRYELWPDSRNAPRKTSRTWRGIAAEYAFFIAVGALAMATAAWFVGSVR
jgi:transcriptional regulator with XRE-family HTH domain